MGARTRIVATVGPASDSPDRLLALIRAGVDVFRVNFSHGDAQARQRQLDSIRRAEAEARTPVAVLADLCGPKIRVRPLQGGQVSLVEGAEVAIRRGDAPGTAEAISTTLDELVDALRPGQPVLLDDGKLRLDVVDVRPGGAVCRVVHGGVLGSGKGLNLPSTDLSIEALTAKDRRDARWIASRSFDFVALSFVRRAADVVALRDLLASLGSSAPVVAKIEKPEALLRIEEIVRAADAVMVARGDLGVEMDLPEVPAAQKRIVSLCRQVGRPCIVATQMLESMTEAPQPTRAEVSDVANAVLDGADAVMLSGETAVGSFPVEAVEMMDRIAAKAQDFERPAILDAATSGPRTPAALACAVRAIVQADAIAAVGVYTATGATARLLSRMRLPVPILALSPDPRTVRRLCLSYGVEPFPALPAEHTREVLAQVQEVALGRGIVRPGEKVVVVSGRPIGAAGCANTLVVHTIGG